MRKQYPFIYPVGLGILFIFAFVLGIDIWKNGGIAFSPGALSAAGRGLPADAILVSGFTSHADFEKDCSQCHQPFQMLQADLCQKCHTQVAGEISSGTGLHAGVDQAKDCKVCHPDHNGRSFNIAAIALDRFNHTKTSFSLTYHTINYDSTPLDCAACHLKNGADYPVNTNACQTCHAQHNSVFMGQHVSDFGVLCLNCHDGKDSMVNFDHNTTSFPLDGPHAQVSCAGCHKRPNFKDIPIQCDHCHTPASKNP
jgi:predicted CXXCH cytochrome family protein